MLIALLIAGATPSIDDSKIVDPTAGGTGAPARIIAIIP